MMNKSIEKQTSLEYAQTIDQKVFESPKQESVEGKRPSPG